MNEQCRSLAELIVARDLTPGDPARQHLDQCSRCQVLLANFEQFGDGNAPTDVSESELASVSAQLNQFLRTRIDTEAPGAAVSNAGRIWRFSARIRWLSGAAAAVLLLLLLPTALRWGVAPDPAPVLFRGDGPQSSELPRNLRADSLALDEIRFHWDPVIAADVTYAVVFYGVDLQEIARVEAGVRTSIDIVPSAVFGDHRAIELWWAVSVNRYGDELGVSRLHGLAMP